MSRWQGSKQNRMAPIHGGYGLQGYEEHPGDLHSGRGLQHHLYPMDPRTDHKAAGGNTRLGGAIIKKIASFRHKTQKFFFFAGSLSNFFRQSIGSAGRPTSPVFQNPTHPPLIQCHQNTPPGNKFAWSARVLALKGDVMTSPLPWGRS